MGSQSAIRLSMPLLGDLNYYERFLQSSFDGCLSYLICLCYLYHQMTLPK